MQPLPDPVAEADRILDAAKSRVVLRMFGGLSFYFRCPSAKQGILQRTYVDIDFVGHTRQSGDIRRLFRELGYVERERFNAMMGNRRLIFNDLGNRRRVDVFLDVFVMCHEFNLKDRLEIEERTLPLADMLATKLQIVEIGEKDIKDILSVLIDHETGDADGDKINVAYLAHLCGDDWGVYKTFTMNLDRVLGADPVRGLGPQEQAVLKARIESLRRAIEDEPKSFKWKMRARVGVRAKWYELPEADEEIVDSRMADHPG